ncbi:hypothetical protein DAKH74_039820 [Maudiozyma humilis]|uniref:Uncharacterized protein n=1 Tax=Maudiozyma humilis TaxID=51915 RepID=A0AAV5S1S8_MAUHU|nr:hypothetical protein DAKH74_039820 [Kazachstania humilis]
MLSNILFILVFMRIVRSAIVSTNIGPVDIEPGFRVRFYESTLPEKPTDVQVKEYLSSQQYVSDGTLLGQLNGITEPTVQYNRYHNDFIHGFYIDPDEIKQFVVEFRGYFKWDKNGILVIRWQSPLVKACEQNLFRTTGGYVKIYPDTYLDTSAAKAICLNDSQMEGMNDYVTAGNMSVSSSSNLSFSKYVVGMWYPIIISVYNAGDALDGEFMYAVRDDPFNYFSLAPENSGYSPNDNYPYFDANRETNPVAKRCPVFDADNYVEPQVPPPYVTTAYTCPSTETSSTVIVPTPSSSSESIVESSSSPLPAESSSSEWSGESTLSESSVQPTSSESSVQSTSSESLIGSTSSTTSEYASSLVSSVVTSVELTEDQSSTDIETDPVPTPQPSSTGPSDMTSVDSLSTAYSSVEFSTAETETSSITEEPQTATTSSVSSDFHSSSTDDTITSPDFSSEWSSMTSEVEGPTETSTHSSHITDEETEKSFTMQSTTTNSLDVPTELSSEEMKSSSDVTTIATASTPTHPTNTGDETGDTQTVGTEIGTNDEKSLSTDKLVTVTDDSNGGVVTTTIVIRPGEGPEGVTTHTLSDTMHGGDISGTTIAEAGGEQIPSGGNVHASTDINNDGNPEYMGTGGLANHPTTTLRGTDDHANSPTKGTSTYDYANNAVDDVQPNETSFAGPSDKTGSTGTSVSLVSYKTVTTATNTHPIQLEEFVGQASSYTVWSSLLVMVVSFALF